jgi:hypothetical protein
MDNEVRIARCADEIVQEALAASEMISGTGVYRDKLMTQREARQRYLDERPKLYRMLRALWRVKDA